MCTSSEHCEEKKSNNLNPEFGCKGHLLPLLPLSDKFASWLPLADTFRSPICARVCARVCAYTCKYVCTHATHIHLWAEGPREIKVQHSQFTMKELEVLPSTLMLVDTA